MKKIAQLSLFAIYSLFLNISLYSQTQPVFNWANQSYYSSTFSPYTFDIREVATDPSNNVYKIGNFEGSVVMGTTTLTSVGNYDGFISKSDNAGNHVWAKSLGGAGTDYIKGLAIDLSGNVYVAGQFSGTLVIGSYTLLSQLSDIFVCKLNNSGNVLWAVKEGGNGQDKVNSIAVDPTGDIYITGTFKDQAVFGSFSVTSTPGSPYNGFVCKIDASSTVQWVKHLEGSNIVEPQDLSIDAAGNIGLIGLYRVSVIFSGNYTIAATNTMTAEIFIAKLSSSGNVVWTETIRGSSGLSPYSIDYDGAGNTFISLEATGTLTLGSNTLSGANSGMLICKLDPAGIFVWNKWLTGGSVLSSSTFNAPATIAVDNSGNAFVAGFFSGTMTLGNSTLNVNSATPGDVDIFVTRIDPAGNFVWAKQSDGPTGALAAAICLDGLNNINFAGSFKGTAVFGTHSLTAINGAFLAQIKEISTVGINELDDEKGNFNVYPNPTKEKLEIDFPSFEGSIKCSLLSFEGIKIDEEIFVDKSNGSIDVSLLPKGIYFLVLEGAEGKQIRKIIVE